MSDRTRIGLSLAALVVIAALWVLLDGVSAAPWLARAACGYDAPWCARLK